MKPSITLLAIIALVAGYFLAAPVAEMLPPKFGWNAPRTYYLILEPARRLADFSLEYSDYIRRAHNFIRIPEENLKSQITLEPLAR